MVKKFYQTRTAGLHTTRMIAACVPCNEIPHHGYGYATTATPANDFIPTRAMNTPPRPKATPPLRWEGSWMERDEKT